MHLIDFHADLRETNELLKRIAEALERAVPEVTVEKYVPKKTEPWDIKRVNTGGETAAMSRLRRLEEEIG